MNSANSAKFQPVKSSNVLALRHSGARLEVVFHGNKRWAYEPVGPELYRILLEAESVGKSLNMYVKGVTGIEATQLAPLIEAEFRELTEAQEA